MMDRLHSVEAEMREDSYYDESGEMNFSLLAKDSFACIQTLCRYMKGRYNAEECTVRNLMRELYLVSATGEYSHLQDFHEIGLKNEAFEKLSGPAGHKVLMYAVRVLRYYYLVYEKRVHPDGVWKEIQELYQKAKALSNPGKLEKRKAGEKKKLSEEEFMKSLWDHMEKNYVGQETLKKKLCSVIDQWLFHDVRTTLLMVGPSGSGKNYMIETIRRFPDLGVPVISYDCSALTPNGFVGADVKDIFKKVHQAVNPSAIPGWIQGKQDGRKGRRCIVFLDEVDKIINFNHDSRGESINAMVQQQLLSSLAGTETIEGINTSDVLFILGGAFPRINDLKKEKHKNPMGFGRTEELHVDLRDTIRDQIIAIGGEVEFVGRIEDIVKLAKLSRKDLRAILMDENIGEFTRKQKIYREAGITLEIEEDTVEEIVDLIVREDAGARSVRNIMNQFADSRYFFDMKLGGYDTMIIHRGMLQGEKPVFVRGGEPHDKSHGYSEKM